MTKKPTFLKIAAGGKVEGLIMRGNSVSGTLLDAQKATIEGLEVSLNKIYGDQDAILLGDAFGVKIEDNLQTLKVPRGFVIEAKEASKDPEKRKSLLIRLSSYLKPSEVEAVAALIDRARDLLP